jgi:hypothetical protein
MENKHTQQVDFSNPNADKITSAVTNTPIIKLTAVEWLISELELDSNSYLIEDIIKQAKAMEKEQTGYSKEDVIKIVEKSRETGLTAEYLLLTYKK